MALTESNVKRTVVAAGDEFLILERPDGKVVQPVVLVNSDGEVEAAGATTIAIGDSPNLDAFSRLRISNPQLRFSSIFDSDKRPILWSEKLTGGGTATHLPNEAAIDLEVSTSGDIVVRQTKEYFVYRSGQSQLIFATFAMDATGDANVQEEVGYFDDDDGLFLRRVGTAVSFVVRSSTTGSPVDAPYGQAVWNLDTLDGSGDENNPSGRTLDITKTQILVIDFQWLGVGRVRFGFDLDGVVVYCHQVLNANNALTKVYMKTPKLPIRYRIEATGAPGAARTLKQICSTVIREGGGDDPDISHEARSLSTNVSTAWETVVGIRVQSGNLRTTLRMLTSEVVNLDTDAIEYSVVLNPSYTGSPTWKAADPDSGAEFARFNAAVSVDGDGDPDVGHVYPLGGFAAGSAGGRGTGSGASVRETVPVAAGIDGATDRDEVWLIARATTGTSDLIGLLTWAEER